MATHGQTVYHWVDGPHALGTLQLGQPAWIAERTGLPVVYDVRSRDIAAGGHGAPLASVLDVLLLNGSGRPAAALNLGGIANITVVRPDAEPVAYDTGPANALLDAAMLELTGGAESIDVDGARSVHGTVDDVLLARLLDEPYYALAPPKTTGKELFNAAYLEEHVDGTRGDDLLATLAALTVETVARELERHAVETVVASGGGTRNAAIMGGLRERLPGVELRGVEELGVPADAKEALVLALIGFLSANGLTSTAPTCTGVSHPVLLGAIVPGARPLVLPEPAKTAPTRIELR